MYGRVATSKAEEIKQSRLERSVVAVCLRVARVACGLQAPCVQPSRVSVVCVAAIVAVPLCFLVSPTVSRSL